MYERYPEWCAEADGVRWESGRVLLSDAESDDAESSETFDALRSPRAALEWLTRKDPAVAAGRGGDDTMRGFSRYALGFGAGAERAGAEAAELYAGEKEDDLNERVVTFFRKELSHRVRPGCKETMDKHKSDGVRCVMCTSSWQHPARAAAALYGLEPDPKDVISSVMEVDPTSGVLTGKIQKVAYGDGKCVVTKEWADANNIDLNLCWFYTDSMSDVALMEAVGFPVAVNPDARLRKHAETKGWPVEDWGLAEDKSKKPRYAYACLTLKGSSQGLG